MYIIDFYHFSQMVSPEGIYGSCGPVSPHLKPDTSVKSWRETKFLTNNLTIAQSQYHCPIPSLPNLIIIAQSQHCPISTVLPDLIIIDQPHNCPMSSSLPNLPVGNLLLSQWGADSQHLPSQTVFLGGKSENVSFLGKVNNIFQAMFATRLDIIKS